MFDSLVTAAHGTRGAAAVGAWARVENAACARRLAASAALLEARLAADGSAEREQWCLDNWDAVAAEIAAAQEVSPGVASHQLLVAMALRERLPRVAAVFATGAISYRLVAAIVARTHLVRDREARARLDASIAAEVAGWGSMSVAKAEAAIDGWVDRIDGDALRRTQTRARGRHVDVVLAENGSGAAFVEGALLAHHGAALDKRLAAMARGVCDKDPRTVDQRRADAMGALADGAVRLACECGDRQCPAAGVAANASVVVNVVVEQESLSDDTVVALDGPEEPGPTTAELRQMTIAQALAQPQPSGCANTNPGWLMGGGIMPAPLLAAKLATAAAIRPIVHPGDSAPEPRYRPSAGLARFVRCRDLTCRFPGCDQPADRCDLDHTIPYPVGPTCASNLSCLCRKHHLLKTFWGWRNAQLPDGTMIWTAPSGRTYTTHPGSRLLFPTLCKPTAAVTTRANLPAPAPNRGVMMPRRSTTRANDRAKAIEAERAANRQARRQTEHADGPSKVCESPWGEGYFPSGRYTPGPDDDPPPF
jgi:hypothetical protein